jgi:hypothetical protein
MRLILSTTKQTYEPDEIAVAYHPRLHPKPSRVKALEFFDASDTRRTFVKVMWLDTGLVQSTHWQNICKLEDYAEPEPAAAQPMPQVDIHLRVPPRLHERLTEIADAQSTSLNQTIVLLLTSGTAGFQFNETGLTDDDREAA